MCFIQLSDERNWWTGMELNHRRCALQAHALPTELPVQMPIGVAAGIEPWPRRSQRRVLPLNYSHPDRHFIGGPREVRTPVNGFGDRRSTY